LPAKASIKVDDIK